MPLRDEFSGEGIEALLARTRRQMSIFILGATALIVAVVGVGGAVAGNSALDAGLDNALVARAERIVLEIQEELPPLPTASPGPGSLPTRAQARANQKSQRSRRSRKIQRSLRTLRSRMTKTKMTVVVRHPRSTRRSSFSLASIAMMYHPRSHPESVMKSLVRAARGPCSTPPVQSSRARRGRH